MTDEVPLTPTVLVVDDYPDALQVWQLYLSSCGFKVLTAQDGPTALEVAIAERPDAILMDLELPGLSGLEVAERLRAHPHTSTIPLIAATGQSDQRQLARARAIGFDAIKVKPCDPETLVTEVRRLLEGRRPSA